MRLNPHAFNRHLANIGQSCLWRRSYVCPCVSAASGSPKPGCPKCGGKGRFWTAPVNSVVGIANQDVQQEWARFGLWEQGDSVVSIPENSPMYEIGAGDRVDMMNSTDRFSVVLTRGGQNEVIKFPVQKLDRVFWLKPEDEAQEVDGAIPTIGANGVPVWTSGAPPLGRQYTITGVKFSEYYCYANFASDRNQHQGARLPRRIVLRRFDLYGRSGTR